MTQAPQLIEIGDVVRLAGRDAPATLLVVRELLPDGEQACALRESREQNGELRAGAQRRGERGFAGR